MKHQIKISSILASKNIIALIIVMFFLGLGLKTSAQSIMIGNDYQKLQSSMKIKLNDDAQLLIPKMTEEEMLMAQDAEQYMLVYKTNGDKGYYSYLGQQWVKQNIRDVFVNTHNNMQLAVAQSNATILLPEENRTIKLVDYNQHISNINKILYSGNEVEYAVNEPKSRED